METNLDVEWAHAIAPGAKIDLLAPPTASFQDVDEAEFYAVNYQLGNCYVWQLWFTGVVNSRVRHRNREPDCGNCGDVRNLDSISLRETTATTRFSEFLPR